MATKFDFTTSEIKVTGNSGKTFGSRLQLKGEIERIENNKIKITVKVKSKYRMYIDNIKFHIGYGTSEKEFKGDYPKIDNGYTELTSKKNPINVKDGEGYATTIWSNTTLTVPSEALYFAIWFTAPSYYHIIAHHQEYNVIGGETISKKLSTLYIPPKNLNLSVLTVTNNSITVKATWNHGTNTTNEQVKITTNNTTKTISSSGNSVTFKNLKGNTTYSISGKLYDGTSKKDDYSISALTKVSPPNNIKTSSTVNSISVLATSYNSPGTEKGNNVIYYKYRYKNASKTLWGKWSDYIKYGVTHTFTELKTNTMYYIEAKAYRNKSSADTNRNDDTLIISTWTIPEVSLNLELVEGSEHNSIKATASSKGSDDYSKYIFRLDSQEFNTSDYNKTIVNPKIYTGLLGHSTHTVGVKMKNTKSGLESDEVTKTITTWHNPISNLTLILDNRWYWYLAIKTGFIYEGDKNKIEYNFAIFNDSSLVYTSTGNINSYSKGTTDLNKKDSEGLNYNTYYNCTAKLTDEHGRTYIVSDVFKTLDERPFYLNNSSNEFNLMEVKLLNRKENNVDSLTYITPNLVNILNKIGDNETVVNLNKVINNDDRSEFK